MIFRSKIVLALLSCVVVGAIVGCVHFFYLVKLQERSYEKMMGIGLAQMANEQKMSSQLLDKIGGGYLLKTWSMTPSSYIHVDSEKKGDEFWIGCFGASWVFGTESLNGFDFPSLLQARLRELGYSKVRVINFAVPWTGLSQSYKTWEEFGHKYPLDFVIVGPLPWEPYWDETFNSANPLVTDLVHGRFILSPGGGVQYVQMKLPLSLHDRMTGYFSLFPESIRWKYDRTAPALISMWRDAQNRTTNPFYYSSLSPDEELRELTVRLMSQLHSSVPLLFVTTEAVLAKDLEKQGVPTLAIETNLSFPFVRGVHFSPFENVNLASLVSARLTGREGHISKMKIGDCKPLELDATKETAERSPSWLLDNRVIGDLVYYKTEIHRYVSISNLPIQPKSVLFVCPPGRTFFDCPAVLIPHELRFDLPLTLSTRGETPVTVSVHAISRSDLRQGWIELPNLQLRHFLDEAGHEDPHLLLLREENGPSLDIIQDSTSILRLFFDKKSHGYVSDQNLTVAEIRPPEDQGFDLSTLSTTGVLTLGSGASSRAICNYSLEEGEKVPQEESLLKTTSGAH